MRGTDKMQAYPPAWKLKGRTHASTPHIHTTHLHHASTPHIHTINRITYYLFAQTGQASLLLTTYSTPYYSPAEQFSSGLTSHSSLRIFAANENIHRSLIVQTQT